jgi:DinB family protein
MNLSEIFERLNNNGAVFKNLFHGVSKDQIHWRPEENKWSMLEIACHLLDEEKEDFRQRLDFTLNKPGVPWPAIDPEGWVKSRKYSDKDFQETITAFVTERIKSITWLNGLKGSNWDNKYLHPEAGSLSAKQLLANWLAHDLLHIRQITATNHAYLSHKIAPLNLHYAGEW